MKTLNAIMAEAWITSTRKDHGAEVETLSDSLEAPALKTSTNSHIMLSASVSHTRNLGNFESLRIEVGVQMPIPSGADLDASQQDLVSWAVDQLKTSFERHGR